MATFFSFGFLEMGLKSGLLRSSKLLISSFGGFQHHNISVGAIALDLEVHGMTLNEKSDFGALFHHLPCYPSLSG